MVSLLLAASAACTGLVPDPLPPPVRIPVGPKSDFCMFLTVDGSGNLATDRDGQTMFFGPDGSLLGIPSKPVVGFSPAQTRGWYVLQTSGLSGASARVSTVDPDGTVSGETFLHDDPIAIDYRLQRDPRGGLVLLSLHAETGGFRVDLRRFSSTAALVDGPRTIARARGERPRSDEWDTSIAADGTIVVVTQGWRLPPMRNNQLVARWFDPAGAAVTPWFVALDQTIEGGVTIPLPDGGVGVWGDLRRGAIHPGSTAADPMPAWVPSDRQVFVLPDRVAAGIHNIDPCEQQIEIFAPSGESCGTIHVPFPLQGGFCNVPFGVNIGLDGSYVLEDTDPKSCDLLEWPRLLGK